MRERERWGCDNNIFYELMDSAKVRRTAILFNVRELLKCIIKKVYAIVVLL